MEPNLSGFAHARRRRHIIRRLMRLRCRSGRPHQSKPMGARIDPPDREVGPRGRDDDGDGTVGLDRDVARLRLRSARGADDRDDARPESKMPNAVARQRARLAANAGRKRGRISSRHPSLLAGLLFTAEGIPFTPSHAVNHGRRYRYYIERPLVTPKAEKAKPRRIEVNVQ